MAVWRRSGSLRQSSPWVPSGVMVFLCVLARTGRLGCRRPCASFPPSSGYTAMSILCAARWRSARGMIEWLCTQERWNPEVANIFGAAARYRRATVGSSHDDAHPDKCPSTLFFPGLGEQKESHLGAAWSGQSLPTCLRSWRARSAV
jgi:hypothetical protein